MTYFGASSAEEVFLQKADVPPCCVARGAVFVHGPETVVKNRR
jgi:hypothetical protein